MDEKSLEELYLRKNIPHTPSEYEECSTKKLGQKL
jgi:hypothetical protein